MSEAPAVVHTVESPEPAPPVERHLVEVDLSFDHEGTYRLAQLKLLMQALEGAEIPDDAEVYVTLGNPKSYASWRK